MFSFISARFSAIKSIRWQQPGAYGSSDRVRHMVADDGSLFTEYKERFPLSNRSSSAVKHICSAFFILFVVSGCGGSGSEENSATTEDSGGGIAQEIDSSVSDVPSPTQTPVEPQSPVIPTVAGQYSFRSQESSYTCGNGLVLDNLPAVTNNVSVTQSGAQIGLQLGTLPLLTGVVSDDGSFDVSAQSEISTYSMTGTFFSDENWSGQFSLVIGSGSTECSTATPFTGAFGDFITFDVEPEQPEPEPQPEPEAAPIAVPEPEPTPSRTGPPSGIDLPGYVARESSSGAEFFLTGFNQRNSTLFATLAVDNRTNSQIERATCRPALISNGVIVDTGIVIFENITANEVLFDQSIHFNVSESDFDSVQLNCGDVRFGSAPVAVPAPPAELSLAAFDDHRGVSFVYTGTNTSGTSSRGTVALVNTSNTTVERADCRVHLVKNLTVTDSGIVIFENVGSGGRSFEEALFLNVDSILDFNFVHLRCDDVTFQGE